MLRLNPDLPHELVEGPDQILDKVEVVVVHVLWGHYCTWSLAFVVQGA